MAEINAGIYDKVAQPNPLGMANALTGMDLQQAEAARARMETQLAPQRFGLEQQRTQSEVGLQGQQRQNLGLEAEKIKQELAARNAYGQVLQGAIDQKTGKIDYGKAAVGLISNPATATLAPTILPSFVSAGLTDANTVSTALDNQLKKMDAVSSSVLPLMKDPNASKSAVKQKLDSLRGTGMLSQNEEDQYLSSFPDTPEGVHSAINSYALAASKIKDSTNQVYGSGQLSPAQQAQIPLEQANIANYEKELTERAQSANSAKLVLDPLMKAYNDAKNGLGPGADLRAKLASGLMAAGLPKATAEQILGAKLESLQDMEKFTAKLAIAAPNLLGIAKNQTLNEEFANSLPKNSDDPATAGDVLATINKFANAPINEQHLYNNAKKSDKNMGYTTWQEHLSKLKSQAPGLVYDNPADVLKRAPSVE